ncbi:MAG: DUF3429 domain-containing protein [Halieaceae bacterium]|nr:DUF3429 domain-containing protein [Halieaceae bacterium]
MREPSLPTVASWLGRAGLLPFLGLSLATYLDPERGNVWRTVLASYALSIHCFLVGAWWGISLIRRHWIVLLISNVFVLIAFFGHIFLAVETFLLLCALLFPCTLIIERLHPLFEPQPIYYAQLRLQLTAVATTALLLAANSQ